MQDARTPVALSLFAALREQVPALDVTRASKSTLVATSHLIETLVARHPGRALLVSGFQQERHWRAEQERYRALAGDGDVVAVFAGLQPPPEWELDHVGVRLSSGAPLTQEWFVLAVAPDLAVVLCGAEPAVAPRHAREGDRLFDVVWSFRPDLVALAAELVAEALEPVAAEQADRIRAALERTAERSPEGWAASVDLLVAGLLERVERLRAQEGDVARLTQDLQERSRLEVAMRLHDGPIQTLTAAQLGLELAAADLGSPMAAEALADALGDVRAAIQECRTLLDRLAPTLPGDRTLGERWRQLAADLDPAAEVDVELSDELVQRAPLLMGMAHRAVGELLTNVGRHAGGRLRRLVVRDSGRWLRVVVEDGGPGGCPPDSPPGHFGLSSLRQEVELHGGDMAVTSTDGGTTVTLRVPLE